MAAKTLRSLAVSAFCEDMAMMLAAGIQVDDALSLMRGDSGDGPRCTMRLPPCLSVSKWGSLWPRRWSNSGYCPAYAAQLVAAGRARRRDAPRAC